MKYVKTFERFVNESVNEADSKNEIQDMKKFGQEVSKILKLALKGSFEVKDKIVTTLLAVLTPFDSDIDMETPDVSDYGVNSISELDEDELEEYEEGLDDALEEYGSTLQYGLKEAMKEAKEDDDELEDEDSDEDSYVAAYKQAARRFESKKDKLKEIFTAGNKSNEQFINEAKFNSRKIAKELNREGYDAEDWGGSIAIENGPNPWDDGGEYTWYWDGESVSAEPEFSDTLEWSEPVTDVDDFIELMEYGELSDGGDWQ